MKHHIFRRRYLLRKALPPRHCAAIAVLFSSAGMCRSALVCRTGSSLCWKTLMNAMPSTKLCGTNCSAVRFWWFAANIRMRLPMRKWALPRNTARSLPHWMAFCRLPRRGKSSPVDRGGDGLSPAGRRFCKHSVWISKRRSLGRAPNPQRPARAVPRYIWKGTGENHEWI